MSLKKFKEFVLGGRIGIIEHETSPKYIQISEKYETSDKIEKPSEVAVILKSELDYISRCILDYKNIETGGQLFGYWSADGTPIVLYAIGPGRKANHEVAFFNQDVEYLVKVGKILHDKYGLHHIGEWHSHHQLGLAQPSGHDASNMHTSISKAHLERFLLCIGNCTDSKSTLNAYNFVEGNSEYVKAKLLVKDLEGLNYRDIIDRQESGTIIQPKTEKACHGNLYLVNDICTSNQIISDYEEGYWYNHSENKKIFAGIVKEILDNWKCNCEPDLDDNKYVHLKIEFSSHIDDIMFPKYFPKEPPTLFRKTARYEKNVKGEWNFDGDIHNSFFKFYNSTLEP